MKTTIKKPRKLKKVLKKSTRASAKPLPAASEHGLNRPTEEQLELLEKAIYHSYKMELERDETGTSTVFFGDIPLKARTGNTVDLKPLFKKIVSVYRTLYVRASQTIIDTFPFCLQIKKSSFQMTSLNF